MLSFDFTSERFLEYMRLWCKEKGRGSQSRLAKFLGITRQNLHQILKGKRRFREKDLDKLGVMVVYRLGGEIRLEHDVSLSFGKNGITIQKTS
jgi:transcriptional regulator with XRE-family HTH domain